MGNFIQNLRNKFNTKINSDTLVDDVEDKEQVDVQPKDLSTGNPLGAFSKFNFNDSMNCVYIVDDLREANRFQDAKDAFDSFNAHDSFKNAVNTMGPFLNYLYEKQEMDKALVKDATINSRDNVIDNYTKSDTPTQPEANQPLSDNEKLISAIIIEEESSELNITYDTLTKFLDISHGRPVTLEKAEFAQLSELKNLNNSIQTLVTRNIVERYPIPDVKQITNIYDTDDLSDLYDDYAKDKYFKNNYKIKNIYAVSPNEQSKNAHTYGKQKLTLNSGTANESLIKIMNGGFKRPSALARENNVQISGQMYGDAVYFAKPSQISKNTAYVDRHNRGSKFIMVADVYFDQKEDADNRGGRYHYDTHNLVHAHSVGRFDRDEFMAAPEQIELKYILEISDGQLVKPKEITASVDDVPDLDLNDLSNGTQLAQ